MGCTKYRCPDCGSIDIAFAEESVTKRRFKMKQNGDPYKKPFDTADYYTDVVVEYLECQSCYSDCRLDDGVALKRWENHKQDNPIESMNGSLNSEGGDG